MNISTNIHRWAARTKHAFWAFCFLLSYSISMVAPFVPTKAYAAAGDLSVGAFEGQNSDLSWSPGNNTQFAEGDYVNYRFPVTSSKANTSGKIYVLFSSCMFTNYFALYGSSAPAAVSAGSATTAGGDWSVPLAISFSAAGTGTVRFTLRISSTGGDCNGSSSHVALDTHQQDKGDFGNIGSKDIPIPANSIYYSPSLTLTKVVESGSAKASDFWFTVSPAVNGQTEIHLPNNGTATSSMTITDVNPAGSFVITEHGPAGYSFSGGTGTNCTVTSSGVMTATTAAGRPATNASCTFSNSVNKGSITIVKDATPNSTQDFGFTATGTGVSSSFILDDDNGVAGADATYNNSVTFSNLLPGNFSFTESGVTGWDLTDLSCEGAPYATTDISAKKVSLSLSAGQNVTCTFTNTQRGKIIVEKQTVPDGSKQSFAFTSNYGDNFNLSDGQQNDSGWMTPGTYNVSETVPSGWTQTSAVCSDGSPVTAISLSAGETVKCTFTNTQLAKLTIIKDAVPNDSQDFAFTTSSNLSGFSLDDDADPTLSNTKVFTDLTAGQTYSVTESTMTGWKLNGLVCSGGATADLAKGTISFTPTAGQEATCTFTNVKLASINGTKWNDQDGDGLWDPGEPTLDGWTIALTGTDMNGSAVNLTYVTGSGSVGSPTASGTGAFSFNYLLPGTYTVKEQMTSAQDQWWNQTSSNPAPITLVAGQAVTNVNFGNQGYGTITIVKHLIPSNDAGKFNLKLDTTVKKADAGDNGTTGKVVVTAGTHMIAETAGTATMLGNYDSSWMCEMPYRDNTSGSGTSGSVTVKAGDNWVCTFTNTRKTGTLKVVKKVFNDNGGKKTAAKDFSFRNNGGTETKFTATTGDNGQAVLTLNIGSSFNVKEIQENKDGYVTTYSGCSGTIMAGEQTCTITNNDKPGTITVIKNVDDGFGHVSKDVTNWTWNFSGPMTKHNLQTGSGNAQQVNAGTYTVSENQKPGYHVVASSCKDDSYHNPYDNNWNDWNYGDHDGYDKPNTSEKVTIGLGEHVTCEFTNKRDTGTITVHKKIGDKVDPQGWTWWLGDSEGSYDMGDTKKVASGWYWFGEDQQDGYTFDSLKCKVDGHYMWVNQGITAKVYVGKDDHVECTFTNSRDTGEVTIIKDAQPDSTQGFEFTIEPVSTEIVDESQPYGLVSEAITGQTENIVNNPTTSFTLVDNGTNDGQNVHSSSLETGKYRISESTVEGWDLSNISCGEARVQIEDGAVYLYVTKGMHVTCTFTNTKRAQLTIVKDATTNSSRSFNFTSTLPDGVNENAAFSLVDDGTGKMNSKQFSNLLAGTYTITETATSSWKLDNISCTGTGVTMTRNGYVLTVTLAVGAVASCTFVNAFVPQVLAETTTLVNTGTETVIAATIALTLTAAAVIVSLQRRKAYATVRKD